MNRRRRCVINEKRSPEPDGGPAPCSLSSCFAFLPRGLGAVFSLSLQCGNTISYARPDPAAYEVAAQLSY